MMKEASDQVSTEVHILAELKKMNKLLTLANGQRIEEELGKYASTNERKRLWTLIDGSRSVQDLIKDSGLKQRSVYDFIDFLEKAGLIEKAYGKPPSRLIDFVPAKWVELTATQKDKVADDASSASETKLNPEHGGAS